MGYTSVRQQLNDKNNLVYQISTLTRPVKSNPLKGLANRPLVFHDRKGGKDLTRHHLPLHPGGDARCDGDGGGVDPHPLRLLFSQASLFSINPTSRLTFVMEISEFVDPGSNPKFKHPKSFSRTENQTLVPKFVSRFHNTALNPFWMLNCFCYTLKHKCKIFENSSSKFVLKHSWLAFVECLPIQIKMRKCFYPVKHFPDAVPISLIKLGYTVFV